MEDGGNELLKELLCVRRWFWSRLWLWWWLCAMKAEGIGGEKGGGKMGGGRRGCGVCHVRVLGRRRPVVPASSTATPVFPARDLKRLPWTVHRRSPNPWRGLVLYHSSIAWHIFGLIKNLLGAWAGAIVINFLSKVPEHGGAIGQEDTLLNLMLKNLARLAILS